MYTARLQHQLARNFAQHQTAVHNADSISQHATVTWRALLHRCLGQVDTCTDITTADLQPPPLAQQNGAPDFTALDWSTQAQAVSLGDERIGEYYVEYLGQRAPPGTNDRTLHIYRFSVRGVDDSGTAEVIDSIMRGFCFQLNGLPCTP